MGRLAPLVIFGLAYFSACALAIAASRIGGGLALVWIATALLAAKLRVVPGPSHPRYLIAACIGSFIATGLFGIGWMAAGPLALVNASEGWIAAALLRRSERRLGLDQADLIGGHFLLSALAAPLCTFIPGALIASLATGVPFLINAENWLIGHVLGYLVLGPLFAMCLRGNMGAWIASLFTKDSRLAAFCVLLLIATSVACFSQTEMPLLFLPTLALIPLTYYGGREGAAFGVALLAAIGGTFSLEGLGPINLMNASAATELQFFQAYLAINCIALLPVSAAQSARDRLFERLRESESGYRLLSDNVTDIVLLTEADGTIRFVSPSIRNYGPYSPDTVVGRNALDLVDPAFHDVVRDAHVRTLRSGGIPVHMEYVGITHAGERRWFETIQRSLCDAQGMATEVVGTVREISARKALESELAITAQTDPLTGLANRRALLDEARTTLTRRGDAAIALLDLDHFKRLNDSSGHDVGDLALQHFAAVAESCLRGSDMLARWGGEEFAVLLPGATREQAATVVQRIIDTLAATQMVHDGRPISLTVSAGVARLEQDIDQALRQADMALYRSKHEGRAKLSVAA